MELKWALWEYQNSLLVRLGGLYTSVIGVSEQSPCEAWWSVHVRGPRKEDWGSVGGVGSKWKVVGPKQHQNY